MRSHIIDDSSNRGVNMSNNVDYNGLMKHLDSLKPYALITTGRTGSDFLQSLLDSHTEVLTFNGTFFFHEFWQSSRCTNNNINLSDLLDQFCGCFIEKFKSKYDYKERKDCLGVDGNQSIDIDLIEFKKIVTLLLDGVELISKNFKLAIYGAYATCLKQDITKKKILLHHIHQPGRLPDYIKDFPNPKILCMTRDPRSNFVSGVENHRLYEKTRDTEAFLFGTIQRIIIDAYAADRFSDDVITLKIEDLGRRCILLSLCSWLGIKYENTMIESTWGGLLWRGDRVSRRQNLEKGFSEKMLDNKWNKKLSTKDKYIFNFIMNDRLLNYGYDCNKIYLHDYFIVFILLIFPLKLEMRYFSVEYMRNSHYRLIIQNIFSYARRVRFFYKVYFQKLFGFKFLRKLIVCDYK